MKLYFKFQKTKTKGLKIKGPKTKATEIATCQQEYILM